MLEAACVCFKYLCKILCTLVNQMTLIPHYCDPMSVNNSPKKHIFWSNLPIFTLHMLLFVPPQDIIQSFILGWNGFVTFFTSYMTILITQSNSYIPEQQFFTSHLVFIKFVTHMSISRFRQIQIPAEVKWVFNSPQRGPIKQSCQFYWPR